MRTANRLILTAALVLSACTSTPTVTTDHSPSASFSDYHTYTWLSKPDNMAPLMQQRMVDSVDTQLRKLGWTEVTNGGKGGADVAVAAHAVLSQKQTLDTMYSSPAYSGWGWRGGWGGGMSSSTTTVRTYDIGTLIIDLFDTKTRQGVWRGTASGTLSDSPETRSVKMQVGVEKMFEKFPN